jgi:hypothetical protein
MHLFDAEAGAAPFRKNYTRQSLVGKGPIGKEFCPASFFLEETCELYSLRNNILTKKRRLPFEPMLMALRLCRVWRDNTLHMATSGQLRSCHIPREDTRQRPKY